MKTESSSSWEMMELQEIGKIVTGNTPSKTQPENYGNEIVWVKPPDLDKKKFIDNSTEKISHTARNLIRLVPPGSVLVSCIGIIGKTAIANCELCTNQQINSIIPKKDIINSEFLYYAIKKIKSSLINRSSSAVVPLLNKSEFSKITIPVPPLTTQKKIVSILEKADKVKELRKKADELTQSYLKAIFLELFGDPGTNNKKWPIVKIDDVIENTQYGTSDKSNDQKKGYPIMGMNNITVDGNIDLSKYNYVDMSEQEFSKLRLRKGDVLFNRTNSPELIGKTAYWDKDIAAVAASYLVKLEMKNNCNFVFFSHLMNTAYFKKFFYSSCKKAVNQANISPTLLKTFLIYLPPITLQNRFADIVKDITEMKNFQKQSKEHIDNVFNNLMQKAFKGELVC